MNLTESNHPLNVVEVVGVDWDELHSQKMALVEMIDSESPLQGLVNLLDEMQDRAEELDLWKHPLAE